MGLASGGQTRSMTQFAPHRAVFRIVGLPTPLALLEAPPTGDPRGTAVLVPDYTGSKED